MSAPSDMDAGFEVVELRTCGLEPGLTGER